MDKVLVEVYLPSAKQSKDVWISRTSKIYEILLLLKKAFGELYKEYFIPNDMTMLYDRQTGKTLDIGKTIYELGIENGTKLMLI